MTAKKSKDGFILINQKIVNQLHLQLNAKCQFQKLIKDHQFKIINSKQIYICTVTYVKNNTCK